MSVSRVTLGRGKRIEIESTYLAVLGGHLRNVVVVFLQSGKVSKAKREERR